MPEESPPPAAPAFASEQMEHSMLGALGRIRGRRRKPKTPTARASLSYLRGRGALELAWSPCLAPGLLKFLLPRDTVPEDNWGSAPMPGPQPYFSIGLCPRPAQSSFLCMETKAPSLRSSPPDEPFATLGREGRAVGCRTSTLHDRRLKKLKRSRMKSA